MHIFLLTNSSIGMSDNLLGAIFTALVTGTISIIGFIVTNMSMKNSFRNELMKQRDNIVLEKMSSVPYDILEVMDNLVKSESEKDSLKALKTFGKIMNKIYSYGSKDAIKIVSLMQEENYALEKMEEYNVFRKMASYVLLATQIKYDITGVYTNPEFWFKMRLPFYDNNREEIIAANNQLVKELNLSDELKIG